MANERTVQGAFTEVAAFYVGGQLNAYSDGIIEEQEFYESVSADKVARYLREHLADSYEDGYFESDNYQIEARHIRFLGNGRIEEMVQRATKEALKTI